MPLHKRGLCQSEKCTFLLLSLFQITLMRTIRRMRLPSNTSLCFSESSGNSEEAFGRTAVLVSCIMVLWPWTIRSSKEGPKVACAALWITKGKKPRKKVKTKIWEGRRIWGGHRYFWRFILDRQRQKIFPTVLRAELKFEWQYWIHDPFYIDPMFHWIATAGGEYTIFLCIVKCTFSLHVLEIDLLL